MNAKKGYYSLIQFCPDPSRLEVVNVGVILFCPEMQFIAARTSKGNRRATKLVGRAAIDKASLNSAKRALERRLEVDRGAFESLEEVQRFVDTRGNVLKLTPPRPVKVFEPEQDLDKLFDELVGGVARRTSTDPKVPELDSVFRKLHEQGRARLDWEITVPVLGRPLRVPYAYANGRWNLVKPQHFSALEGPALGAAMRLAIEGDLLFNHETEDNGKKQLIVVSSFDSTEGSHNLEGRVQEVLDEYNVRTVPATHLSAFLAEVQAQAHA